MSRFKMEKEAETTIVFRPYRVWETKLRVGITSFTGLSIIRESNLLTNSP